MEKMKRIEAKKKGGKIIYSERHGEVTKQLWRLPDGSFWVGDD